MMYEPVSTPPVEMLSAGDLPAGKVTIVYDPGNRSKRCSPERDYVTGSEHVAQVGI